MINAENGHKEDRGRVQGKKVQKNGGRPSEHRHRVGCGRMEGGDRAARTRAASKGARRFTMEKYSSNKQKRLKKIG